ncbi:uncharacterized protein BP01DRAFT_420770 [Aspergillus saccharolyticus JOP 1030-1]|uniref:Inner kinetochore subunit AME1 domain-containing protein n=1 Tax=Aspergillus saccharolyticus JOP 1030-1 TaxID=1450539 RepID=A0A318ZXZ8_9EURO|nr:hypothetical protein BP01DRAFT_420770 [Aspergillus saccharolyticus JOP 1030-1]PYH49060.1 hypothetical protein BP01DRAFT_420770 [Aspergillus saccharolyticus JOP 1030-1]
MNINREERLQMRQRGAASRKTKEINFGFSFGLAPAPEPSATEPASRPADVGIASQPSASLAPPPTTTEPPATTETTTIVDETVQNGSLPIAPVEEHPSTAPDQNPPRRKSRSPRTRSSPRLSPSGPQSNDATEAGPSRKIRKLDHPRSSPTTSLAAPGDDTVPSLINGTDSIDTAQPVEESAAAISPTPESAPAEPPIEKPASPVAPPAAATAPDVLMTQPAPPEMESASVDAQQPSPTPTSASPTMNGTPSPPGKKARGKRKRQGSQESANSPSTTPSPKASNAQIGQPAEPMDLSPDVRREPTEIPATAVPDAVEPSTDNEVPSLSEQTEPVNTQAAVELGVTAQAQKTNQPQSTLKQSRLPVPSRTKRPRGERAASVQASTTTVREPRVARAGSIESAPTQVKGSKRIRTRIDDVPEPTEEPPVTNGKAEGQRMELDAPEGGEVGIAERKEVHKGRPQRLDVAESKPKRAGRPGRQVLPSLRDVVEEEDMPVEKAQKDVQESGESAPQPKRRGRKPKIAEPQPVEPEPSQPEPEQEPQPAPAEAQPKPRGRRPKQIEPEPASSEREQAEPEPETQEPAAGAETAPPKPRGRRAKPTEPMPELAQTAPELAIPDSMPRGRKALTAEPEAVQQEPSVPKLKLRGRRVRTAEPEPTQAEPKMMVQQPAEEPRPRERRTRPAEQETAQPEPEPAAPEAAEAAPKRGRKARGAKPIAQQPAEELPEPELADAERAEPEQEPRFPSATVEPQSRKRGRGTRQPADDPNASATREADTITAEGESSAGAQTRKRKPHQPRGETVPVTVHRLANVAALGGDPTLLESSDDEGETPARPSDRLQTKLPNRGGVNVADVLGQICRETLEKMLTSLTNNIEGEGNTARRAEFTRKKKVVEAYGAELEGRLLELSEMLDGNFVLGVKMRKAKREMMDYRSRLYQVRREREAVALQMDAVRRKHAEDESARKARATINNSLHSLDLALERSQTRPGDLDETSTDLAGMEFLLRNVAETVSSAAPGGQGGLLHQLRSFNAQLESTARRLES